MKKIAPAVVVIFVFCVVFAGGFFGLVYPSIKPIGRKLSKLAAYSQQSTKAVAPSSRSAELEAQRQQLELEKDKISKLLPDESNVYDLSIQIEALAKSTGVTMTSVSLLPAAETTVAKTKSTTAIATVQAPPAGTATSTIAVSLSGSYDALRSFLDGITQLERYIEVVDVSFASGTSGVSMTLSAVAFSAQKAPAATPAPAATSKPTTGGKDE